MYRASRAYSFAAGFGNFTSSLMIALLISLLLIRWAVRYFVFRKAGEAGWKSFIPFYGAYTSYKIVWDGKIYWALMIAMAAGFTFSFPFFFLHTGVGYVLSLLLNTVTIGAYIFAEVLRKYKMSKSFGMKDKHFVGLCLLNNLFSCIAAFGEYEYQGVQYKDGIGVPAVLANMGKKPAPVYQQPPQGYEYQPQAYQPYQQPQQNYEYQAPAQPEFQAAPQQPIARRSERNNATYNQY